MPTALKLSFVKPDPFPSATHHGGQALGTRELAERRADPPLRIEFSLSNPLYPRHPRLNGFFEDDTAVVPPGRFGAQELRTDNE